MLTSSVGKASSGVTLIELLMVVAIVGLIVSISFPSVSAGLDTLRLSSASDALVSFLNSAVTRAERRQQVVEISISPKSNALWIHSTEPGFERRLEMPDGVRIEAVWPKLPLESDEPSRFLVLPGGTPPRIGIEISNRKGTRRLVRVDPLTGVPRIERVESP